MLAVDAIKRWIWGAYERVEETMRETPMTRPSAVDGTQALPTSDTSSISITVEDITITEPDATLEIGALVPTTQRRRHLHPRPTRRERACAPVWAMPVDTPQWQDYLNAANLDALADALTETPATGFEDIDLR